MFARRAFMPFLLKDFVCALKYHRWYERLVNAWILSGRGGHHTNVELVLEESTEFFLVCRGDQRARVLEVRSPVDCT